MKKYLYPEPRLVAQSTELVVVTLGIDFENEKAKLVYRERGANGQIVSSPMVVLPDLLKLDAFAEVAATLPGSTFGEKLLAPVVLRNILPFVPAGGTVEDG